MLLQKLQGLGMAEDVWLSIKDYLANRNQVTNVVLAVVPTYAELLPMFCRVQCSIPPYFYYFLMIYRKLLIIAKVNFICMLLITYHNDSI